RECYDLVHVHGFKASLPGRLAAALAGTPVVYTVHNFVFEAGGRARRRAYLWAERLLAPLTAHYIAVSGALRRDLVSQVHLDPRQVSVIYGGIPPHSPAAPETLDALRQELALAPGVRVFLSAARLVPEKGVDLLLQAVAALLRASRAGDALPPLRLLVAGDGPEEASLRDLADRLELAGSVAFLGHRSDVPALLELADAVVLPSRAEGLSLFLLEALAAGRPVVAAAAGGMVEIVSDGENGLLVPVEDPLALAAALRRLLTEDGLARHLAERARQSGARFTVEGMLQQTLDVYEKCRRPARPSRTAGESNG
ncbi:MAG TPA: glycosyltransferase family 4 protein, partial [Firmicutes bacterium]|nr:glycosyltransferase family 4 protein [Bacillota bacterium]